VGYIGCIGSDDYGRTLKQTAEKAGVTTHYLVDPQTPTGTCACLVTNKERSLVANLAAAEKYKIEHLQSAEIQQVINKAKFIYCTGFFLTHSPHVLKALGEHAAQHNKYFLMNLSAPFLIDFFWEQMSSVLPYTDVVFCNEVEAATLGKKLSWGEDLDIVAKNLSNFKKVNTSRKRIVIFTQGAKQTVVYHDGQVSHFIPIKLDSKDIVDTNGAGDSFVGGFLSRFVQQKPLETCIAAGHYCAMECLKQPGCTFPPSPKFDQ